jgi:phosphatidylglycerophosphate synthase
MTDVEHAAGLPRKTAPDVPGSTWRIRHSDARARLATAQKSNSAVSAYLRYVNRKVGGRLACLGYAWRVTPSQVSVAGAVVAALGLVLVATLPSTVLTGVIAAVLLALGYALDSADGQLARLQGGGTPAGEWLDHVLDIAKTCALHSCVAIAVYRHVDVDRAWLLVPLAFLLAQVTAFFGTMMRDALRLQAGLPRQPASTRNSLRSSLVLLPFDHGTLCWTFVLLGWHTAFLTVYTALAVVSILFAARALVRGHRNLVTLGAGPAT